MVAHFGRMVVHFWAIRWKHGKWLHTSETTLKGPVNSLDFESKSKISPLKMELMGLVSGPAGELPS